MAHVRGIGMYDGGRRDEERRDEERRYGIERVPRNMEFGRRLVEHFHHFVELQKIMEPTRDEWHPCGTYLMGPESMDYDPRMIPKQWLLYEQAKGKKRILEIGVHGAHSLLVCLIASPEARITCVDICHWTHVEKCVAYLQTHFPDRIAFIKGDSASVLPSITETFDLVHVDGDHSYEGAKSDMVHAHRLSHPETSFVIDDFCDGIERAVHELSDVYQIMCVPGGYWNNCLVRRRR